MSICHLYSLSCVVSYQSNNLHQEYFSHVGKVISLLEVFPVPWGWPRESSSESGGSRALWFQSTIRIYLWDHTSLTQPHRTFFFHSSWPILVEELSKARQLLSMQTATLCHGKEAEIRTVCASVQLTFSTFTVQNAPGHKGAQPLWIDLLVLIQNQYYYLYLCSEARFRDARSCQADRSTSHYKCHYLFGTLCATRMRPLPTKQESSRGQGGICMVILCALLKMYETHYIYQLQNSDMIIC